MSMPKIVQHFAADLEVALAGDGDVVIAGIVEQRVAVIVDGDFDRAFAGLQRFQISGRIVMIVKVNDGMFS